jgi:IS605 OrfB family transposase
MRSVNHEISKRIVSSMDAEDIIVMEDLQGIRAKRRGKDLNRLLGNWSFNQLRNFVEYKSVRKGIVFCTISPAYTSKMCHRCHEITSVRPKRAGFFKCLNCGYSCNADLNASFNLRERANALRNACGLSVNQPIVVEYDQYSGGKPTPLGVGN